MYLSSSSIFPRACQGQCGVKTPAIVIAIEKNPGTGSMPQTKTKQHYFKGQTFPCSQKSRLICVSYKSPSHFKPGNYR